MQSYHYYYCYCCVFIISATLIIPTVSHGKLSNNVKIVSGRPLHKSPSFGGESGIPFDDVEFFNGPDQSPISMILAVNVSSNSFFIESIQVLYFLANLTDSQTPIRGTSKNLHYIPLSGSEHIALVEGSTNGVAVTQLTMTMMESNGSTTTHGPFGKEGATEFSFQGYIAGFYGRSETFLTNIGVYYYDELKKSQEFGDGFGGSRFDDHTDISSPPIVGISIVTLWHGAFLNGIQTEYVVQGGNKLLGEVHGGTDSTLSTTITLKPGDTLEHAEFGHTPGGFITLLNFTIRRTSGGTEVLGPFGYTGVPAYKFDGNILGFHGHAEKFIYKLGFYYDQTVV